jgi:hypothetical protein
MTVTSSESADFSAALPQPCSGTGASISPVAVAASGSMPILIFPRLVGPSTSTAVPDVPVPDVPVPDVPVPDVPVFDISGFGVSGWLRGLG